MVRASAALTLGLLFIASPALAEDLTFSRALKLARQRAPEMKVAKAGIDSADAQVDVARSTYFPTLNATGTGSETASAESAQVLPPPARPLTNVQYTTAATAGGQVRWILFDFGRTWNNVDAAEAGKKAATADAANTESQLLSSVANAYLDVAYGERIRDINRAIVEEREKSIVVVKALVKQGLAPAVEELRAQSRVSAARRELELAEATYLEARVGLLTFLGLDPKSQPTISMPRLPKAKVDAESAVKDAEAKRPDVLTARAVATQGEALVDAARARYYPTLQLNGDASYRVAKLDVFDSWLPARSAAGALVLSIPIFDASIGARLDVAKADADRNQALYEQARRTARIEAAQTAVSLTTSEKVLEQAKKAAEASAAVVAVIRARYVQGLSSTLDLIDAETTDAEARIASARAERSVDGAVVRYFVATGRYARLLDVP